MALILIIEDEAPIRDNLQRFLRLEGHQVLAAPDGQAGLDCLRSQAVDLVICDYMMPRMNGFEVLAAMQVDPALVSVPLIMLSASAEPERLEQATALGAKAYVTKPFQFSGLRALIERHLADSSAAS